MKITTLFLILLTILSAKSPDQNSLLDDPFTHAPLSLLLSEIPLSQLEIRPGKPLLSGKYQQNKDLLTDSLRGKTGSDFVKNGAELREAEIWGRLSAYLLKNENPDSAYLQRCIDHALEKDPRQTDALLTSGGLNEKRGNHRAALSAYTTLLSLDSTNIEALRARTALLTEMELFAPAAKDLQRIINIEENETYEYRSLYAFLLFLSEQYRESYDEFSRISKKWEERAYPALCMMGLNQIGLKNYSGCRNTISFAQFRDEKNPTVSLINALSYKREKRYRKMVRSLERAKDLDPQNEWITYLITQAEEEK